MLLEQEFIQNQERLKPIDETRKQEEEKIDKIRQCPLSICNLEEMIDDDHCIIAPQSGVEFYVSMLSIVDKDLIEPNVQIITDKHHHVVGILEDDQDPTVAALKVEEAPSESYADIGGLDEQVREIKEAVELPLTNPELYEEVGISAPKGVILYGEPGTGKTLLAKAVAN